MTTGINDLSKEQVDYITKLLARRPDYGIALPSRRWFQRQQEKMERLPKALLRPSALKRFAIKIIDHIDPSIVDPQAILCQTHSLLNPFLIRRLFVALAYEVTVHTDPLRSWPGRTSHPELSAMVGRLDSITALWTEPQLFTQIYGLAPFDGHHIFVKSMCEACCLAAVGANGRVLADMRAALIDRTERRRGGSVSGKGPRLLRIVESWIGHLHKDSEVANRAEGCRALSEALLVELRSARPQILAWRAEQKELNAKLPASQRPVRVELSRSKTGGQIKAVSAGSHYHRRTRNGIPIASADIKGAEDQKRAAMERSDNASFYRPDSVAGFSQSPQRPPFTYDIASESGSRPKSSGAIPANVPNDDIPKSAFLHRFEDADDDILGGPVEGLDAQQRDYMEESRSKVMDWTTNRLSTTQLAPEDDRRSVLSMMHPAFRPPMSQVAESAMPVPLQIKKDREAQASAPGKRGTKTVSVWTDCTVHTVEPNSRRQPNSKGAPSMPQIPESCASKKSKHAAPPLNWPAPPSGVGSTATGESKAKSSGYASSSVYDGRSVSSVTVPSSVPSSVARSSAHTATRKSKSKKSGSSSSGSKRSKTPAVSIDELMDPAKGWGNPYDDEVVVNNEPLSPDDSASNVNWTRKNSESDITNLGKFRGKM